jgi:hypothetical protein
MADSNSSDQSTIKPDEQQGLDIQGHIKIFDPESGQVYVDKNNAIHYENFSEALAKSIANRSTGFIEEMHFGNGGTSDSIIQQQLMTPLHLMN